MKLLNTVSRYGTIRGDKVRVFQDGPPSRVALATAAMVLAFGTSWVVGSHSVDIAWVIIGLITVILIAPIATRVVNGQFDVFEPLIFWNLAFGVMYIGRPIGILISDKPHMFKGDDVWPLFHEALLVAAVGCLFLQLGYSVPMNRRIRALAGRTSAIWNTGRSLIFAIALTTLASALYGLFIMRSGGISALLYLAQGRAYDQLEYFSNSTAYLYSAPQLFWPASLLVFAIGTERKQKALWVFAIVLMVPLALMAGGRGDRIQLVPLFGSPIIYYYLARGKRPSLKTMAIVMYVLFTVFLGFFRDTREISGSGAAQVSNSEVLMNSLTNPLEQVSLIVLEGNSNDMFESLSAMLAHMPKELQIDPKGFILGTIAKPIPSILWKEKPLAPEEVITTTMYPDEISRASSSSGVVGNLYFGGGFIGVVLGMFAFGVLYKWIWVSWYARKDDVYWTLILVMSLMFVLIIARGAVGDSMARALFAIVPIVVASLWSARVRAPRRSSY